MGLIKVSEKLEQETNPYLRTKLDKQGCRQLFQ